jgi:dienelactone hydrolase
MSAQDGYLAKPSGPCCLKGTIHEGEPRGIFTKLADIDTYISTPADEKANGHILLYFPDVWGMFTNGLLIMDGFADAGFLVLGPDYFRGVSTSQRRSFRQGHR